jgi:hypothetical protein
VKKKVVEFICDNCGAEDKPQETSTVENPLPELWVRVQMAWNFGVHEPVELCGDCRSAFANALLERRTK